MTMPWFHPVPNEDAAARAGLRRMAASVAVASGLAETGRQIDLAGLDGAAKLLCAQVLDLHPNDGAAIRPAMTELAESIGMLINTLRASRAP